MSMSSGSVGGGGLSGVGGGLSGSAGGGMSGGGGDAGAAAAAAAANLYSLSALAALHSNLVHYGASNPSPAIDFSPAALGPEADAKLIDYRGEKVAGFTIDSNTMICLPQAYELFLKNMVGGLHTVYTKLKRLDIVPRICNVEQVRALRSLGAIQPGVNRCNSSAATTSTLSTKTAPPPPLPDPDVHPNAVRPSPSTPPPSPPLSHRPRSTAPPTIIMVPIFSCTLASSPFVLSFFQTGCWVGKGEKEMASHVS